MTDMRAGLVGIAGSRLAAGERALFAALPPAGIILFRRNVIDPVQLRALTDDIRAALPDGALVAVDQEGGRVARLRPPHWRAHPPAAAHRCDRSAWITGALIGADCRSAGIDLVCAPVLDLAVPGASDVVGDRAWSADAAVVASRGRAMAAGLAAAGCIAVGKHAPGHGRARVDSHHHLPRIEAGEDLATDLGVFRACAGSVPWLMTAHIVYDRWDTVNPATCSARIVRDVIRGQIGFTGVIVSDDLAMHALSGTPGERAARSFAAGVDMVMHCTGELDDAESMLLACPRVPDAVRARMAPPPPRTLDTAALAAERDGLLA